MGWMPLGEDRGLSGEETFKIGVLPLGSGVVGLVPDGGDEEEGEVPRFWEERRLNMEAMIAMGEMPPSDTTPSYDKTCRSRQEIISILSGIIWGRRERR